jgi:hypothetical protein
MSKSILTIECDNDHIRDVVRDYLCNIDNAQLGVHTGWVDEESVTIETDRDE